MPNTAHDLVYLASISPRDARFDAKRLEVSQFRKLYDRTSYPKYAQRMEQCSPKLDFAFHLEDNGFLTPKLQAAHFCRVRLCPMCQWRRALMWQAKALRVIPKVIEDYPKSRFVFLTLTVRNCQLSDLRETIKWMNGAWAKLVKRKEFSAVQGWMRSVEVTRGSDGTAHPHYHALLMVRPGYFSKSYVSQKQWTEAWEGCLGINYTPIVDIRPVRPGKREKGEKGVLMMSAICETLKYSVKPSECLSDNLGKNTLTNEQWLEGLTEQLHKMRAIATGGLLKKYLRCLEQDPEDLIHADETGLTEIDDESPRMRFAWRESTQRYVASE